MLPASTTITPIPTKAHFNGNGFAAVGAEGGVVPVEFVLTGKGESAGDVLNTGSVDGVVGCGAEGGEIGGVTDGADGVVLSMTIILNYYKIKVKHFVTCIYIMRVYNSGMRPNIAVKETTIDDAVLSRQTSIEFGETYRKEDFEKRCKGKNPLIIAAYLDDGKKPVGYLIGFDRFKDGSFYCWLSGVWSEHGKRRIFHALMMYAQRWARKQGYKSIKIKTRNKRMNILHYLIKSGYYFLEVTPDPNPAENRILLEKNI